MKEIAINKIKNFGKIGNIIAIIAKVILIVAIVGVIIGGAVFAAIPKDFIHVDIASKAKVTMDGDKFGKEFGENITDEEIAEINQELKEDMEAEMKLNNMEYVVASVTRDGNKVIVDTEAANATLELKNFVWIMVAVVLSLAMGLVVTIFAGRLCRAFRDCETPFEERIIKRIKHLGFAMIPMAILPSITDSFVNSVMIGKVKMSVSVDVAVILAILIVFVIAYVFKYGAMLQQESDETL